MLFRDDDPLVTLNTFLKDTQERMELFMEAVTKQVEESEMVDDNYFLNQINLAEDAACILSYLQQNSEDFNVQNVTNHGKTDYLQLFSTIKDVKRNIADFRL